MHGILENGPLSSIIDWKDGEPADREDLLRFHQASYIDELESIPNDETRWFSGTTVFGPGSYEICKKAAGLAIDAAQYVYNNSNQIAYALCRPPGHHAQPDMADGYCFFNNIGVAIEKLRSQGMKRAVVIDWDVHHGNGTQEGFYEDPDVLTISMHMNHGAWGNTHPQSGDIEETGRGKGIGKNLNIPMPYGSGDIAYTRLFDELITPMVLEHDPEIIFIANGQDANQFDPNGRQLLSMNGFYELGKRAHNLANQCCDGKLVLIQEGGYAISYASYCLHASLAGALNTAMNLDDPLAYMQEDISNLDQIISAFKTRFREANGVG